MINTLKILLSKSILCGFLFAQFQVDLPIQTLPTNINGELDNNHYIFDFNLDNFQYNYGLTVSMLSSNGQSFSVAGFNNNIMYKIKNNLWLNANVTLMKSNLPFQQQSTFFNNLDFAYNADLTYKPSENSLIQFRIQRMPFNYLNQNHFSNMNSSVLK